MKKCNLSKLLLETLETYYWIGFILADGHISKSTRLRVTLAKRDKNHLIKLQKFLNVQELQENTQVSISGMDSKVIREFCNKFDIKSNKTYNPPNLSFIKNKDLLFALSIGFIDGDGCIDNQTNRSDCKLRIKCHSSWVNNLEFIYNIKSKINNQGYAYINITNSILLKELKRKAIFLNLPILNRKWDKIDLSFVSKQEKGQINVLKVKEMLKNNIKKSDIAKNLNIGKSAISQIIKRNKL